MEYERDDSRTDAVEDCCYRLKIAEIDVECPQRRHDHEIGKDEAPTAQPGPPKAATEPGDIDAYLDRQRPGKRLADCDRFAHLLFAEPLLIVDQLPLHLAYKRHGAAEAKKAEAQEIKRQFCHPAAFDGRAARRGFL